MPAEKPAADPRPDTGDSTPPHGEILNEERTTNRRDTPPAGASDSDRPTR